MYWGMNIDKIFNLFSKDEKERIFQKLAHKINKSEIFLATTVGHVSNFNIQKPNSGYNILGFELGYRVFIK